MNNRLIFAMAIALIALPAGASAQTVQNPEIHLISAGRAPLSPLRHRVTDGAQANLELRAQTRVQMQMGERSQDRTAPTIVIRSSVGPASTEGETISYDFSFSEVELEGDMPEEARSQYQSELAVVQGLSGHVEVDNRGQVSEFRLNGADEAEPRQRAQMMELASSMAQLLPPLPEEAIGIGARWSITGDMALPTGRVQSTTTYTLRRRRGNRVELAVQMRLTNGQEQPEGGEVSIEGDGRIRFEAGAIEVRATRQSSVSVSGTTPQGEMQMRLRSRTRVAPAE